MSSDLMYQTIERLLWLLSLQSMSQVAVSIPDCLPHDDWDDTATNRRPHCPLHRSIGAAGRENVAGMIGS